jgi:hypothetical protein
MTDDYEKIALPTYIVAFAMAGFVGWYCRNEMGISGDISGFVGTTTFFVVLFKLWKLVPEQAYGVSKLKHYLRIIATWIVMLTVACFATDYLTIGCFFVYAYCTFFWTVFILTILSQYFGNT